MFNNRQRAVSPTCTTTEPNCIGPCVAVRIRARMAEWMVWGVIDRRRSGGGGHTTVPTRISSCQPSKQLQGETRLSRVYTQAKTLSSTQPIVRQCTDRYVSLTMRRLPAAVALLVARLRSRDFRAVSTLWSRAPIAAELRGSCKWLWGQTRAGGRACGSGSGRRMAVGSAGPCRKTTEHVGGTKGVKCRQRARENVTGIDQKVTASLCCGKVSCSFCCLTGSSGLGSWGHFGCERLVTCSHRHARPWPRMGVCAARAP